MKAVNLALWSGAIAWGLGGLGTIAATPARTDCPDDIEKLAPLLLRDIPSYANRASRSTIALQSSANPGPSVLLAGRPEFEPLPLRPGTPAPDRSQDPKQIFFTTLERQYQGNQILRVQHYHWLFLTQTSEGWRLVTMFSSLDALRPGLPSTPPRESSQGALGRAVHTWLRDCRAGKIAPL